MSKEQQTEDLYGADAIEVFEGIEHVRIRPAMYTQVDSPTHIAQEVIDNATDEILAKFASECNVTIHEDGSMTVTDNGRGIPVDIHRKKKIPAVEVIFTEMNSGGKFSKGDDKSAYDFSGGLHGVGVTVTNALSEYIEVTVKRGGKIHFIRFENGKAVKQPNEKSTVSIIGECPTEEKGTSVRFKPEGKYFDSPLFNVDRLRRLLKAKAVLLKDSVITLKVEGSEDYKSREETWSYSEGMKEYLVEQLEKSSKHSDAEFTPVYADSMFIEDGEAYTNYSKGEGVSWALSFLNGASNIRESYVNLVPTRLGGTHVTGFEKGVFEAVKAFANRNALVPKGLELRREDVTSRLSFLVSANVLEPKFQGQTKEQLLNADFNGLAELCIKGNFDNWLQNNFEIGVQITEGAIQNAQERAKAEKKIVIRKTNSVTSPLPDKLSDCTSKDPMSREVFIVEGDSAGGSAKQARCKITQAIMPLKGKPTNAWDFNMDAVLGSEEIADISTVIGVRPHTLEDDPKEVLKGLRYKLMIVLADADIDGYHISTLVTGIIVKHFPHMITGGHFAICQTPLYRIEVRNKGKLKGGKFYVQDDKERDSLIKKLYAKGFDDSKISTSRFKGLGEMNPDQLSETALSPDTRTLIIPQLNVEEIRALRERLDPLLAKKRSDDRRRWIEREGDFDKFDY